MLPFEDSRRLLGSNPYFRGPGAVLEAPQATADPTLIGAWRARVDRAARHLAWSGVRSIARAHASGLTLGVSAPEDALFLATEINEWALMATLIERNPEQATALSAAWIAYARESASATEPAPADLDPLIPEPEALARFTRLAAQERRPDLQRLLEEARHRGVSHRVEDSRLVLGSGSGSYCAPLTSLPSPDTIPWSRVRDVPTVLVTGSNGKTTTVRLLAACAREQGWIPGYNCTDGVFIGDETVEQGDYSGPAGARLVLDDARTQAALLETARGGILRRGLAVDRADAAVVTNISADHFGEYGIHDLDALAQVKLTVAAALGPGGLLVLNADDAALRAQVPALAERYGFAPRLAWFSALGALGKAVGGDHCSVQEGRLMLSQRGVQHDLGSILEMPLTLQGLARYNVANLAAAALGACAIGVAPETVRSVFARFGARVEDNPGRLMRFEVQGATILLDYAHNPDGLSGLLSVARGLRRGRSRLGLLLGTAGNRLDADIEALARVAARFQPDLIVVKENEAHLRGRAPGEIPRILAAELRRQGMPDSVLLFAASELEAARLALQWARAGDVLALPVHSPAAREGVLQLLAARR
jgi:UDP-N-acetylmuramyl tripeptide synthase